MTEEFIDYSALVDEAMHIIVKKSLTIVSENAFCGDHHFFISFLTSHPGVMLSKKLQNKYPEEMTIVLQHQYKNLKIFDDRFAVTLSFDSVEENIIIPFKALTAFADPSVKFGLQFKHFDEVSDSNKEVKDNKVKKNSKLKKITKTKKLTKTKDNNVVMLDHFRK